MIAIESTDNGKALGFSDFDISMGIDVFRYMAGWTDKIHGQTLPTTGPYFSYTKNDPIGVVGAIIPWNFPFLLACFKLAPVLATGCTTILKPAENTPLSALKLAEILVECGMP